MSCQRQAATVEERRDVGRAVVCRWIEAHCSPLAWLSRCWSAGRHRRTGTSGTLLGPVGVNTLPARRLPPPFGGISSRSSPIPCLASTGVQAWTTKDQLHLSAKRIDAVSYHVGRKVELEVALQRDLLTCDLF
jgi:hypothetical protein